MSAIIAKLKECLKQLDKTDNISEMLIKECIKGKRFSRNTCPLAIWLSKHCGQHVAVDRNQACIKPSDTGFYTYASFGDKVTEFIVAFDKGSISQLDLEYVPPTPDETKPDTDDKPKESAG